MANECLVTKLKKVVNNDNLERIGELRIRNTSSSPQMITLGYGGTQKTLTVVNGYFTDATGTQNLGTISVIEAGDQYKTKNVYISANAILCVPDKYELRYFLLSDNVDEKYWDFNEESFSFCTAIKYINLSGLQKQLKISALKNMTSIISFTLKASNIYGDIANLKNFTDISGTVIIAYNRFIQGDISTLSKWTKVNSLTLAGTKVTGSINALGDAMYNNGNGRVSGTLIIDCSSYNSFAPTINYTEPHTSETKLIDGCTLEFSASGVTYTPIYRS